MQQKQTLPRQLLGKLCRKHKICQISPIHIASYHAVLKCTSVWTLIYVEDVHSRDADIGHILQIKDSVSSWASDGKWCSSITSIETCSGNRTTKTSSSSWCVTSCPVDILVYKHHIGGATICSQHSLKCVQLQRERSSHSLTFIWSAIWLHCYITTLSWWRLKYPTRYQVAMNNLVGLKDLSRVASISNLALWRWALLVVLLK